MVKSLNIDLEDMIEEILEEETQLAQEAIIEAQEETGKEIVQLLKNTSPVGNRTRKKYKNGWKYELVKGRLTSSLRIYNTQSGLTHLLEYGHVMANKYGKYSSRAKARPHIKPAEEKAKTLIIEKIEKKL